MCPVITISDKTFAMLKQVAEPLVDTEDSVIQKMFTVYIKSAASAHGLISGDPIDIQSQLSSESTSSGKIFDPDSPPSLTHASFVSGKVAGISVNRWNYLLIEAHAQAFKSLGGDLAALQRVSEAHVREGEITESGFKPVRKLGFSVQGVEANKAWIISLRLAKRFNFPIQIEFRWQQKEGAAFPGELGQMEWKA
jgi:hypothetical protein